MNTAFLSSACARPRPAGTKIKLLAASALLVWALAPLDAAIIDDFNGAKKYTVFTEGGRPEIEVIDGQLKSSRPSDGAATGFYYRRNYAIPEGRPVAFQVDVVSLNPDSAFAFIAVEFPPHHLIDNAGASRYYGLFWSHTRVAVVRQMSGTSDWLIDSSLPRVTVPVTLTLSLNRKGNAMELGAKVVQRDNPSKVVYDGQVTAQTAFPDPTDIVTIGYEEPAVSGGRVECVLDNFLCSSDEVPLPLGIQRPATGEVILDWQGLSIPLESNSIQGPWTPLLDPITTGTSAHSVNLASSKQHRFFRLAPGWHGMELFDNASGGWETGSPVPGRVWKPSFSLYQRRGHIHGEGVRNEDFLLRFAGDAGNCYRDCVASVDVVDWDETMEDAGFGILLRVKPEGDLWFCGTEGLPTQHYGGLLTFKTADNPAESALTITGPGDVSLAVQRFPALNPEKQYRLRFWAVGRQLTLEVFDLDDLETPIATCARVDGRIAEGMSALYGTRSRSAVGKYDVTIDRFMLSGATPW